MSSVYDVLISEKKFASRNSLLYEWANNMCLDVSLFPVFCFTISLCSHARVSKVYNQ